MHIPRICLTCLGSGVIVLSLMGCPDGGKSSKTSGPSLSGPSGVARLSLPGVGLEIRKAGKLVFTPWAGEGTFAKGTTIRSRDRIVTLTFMGSVEVQLGTESELILEGLVKSKRGIGYVLGLKKGEVMINSYADYPLSCTMPHAEVRGSQGAYFRVKMERDRAGSYCAHVDVLSQTNLVVTNEFGSLPLNTWGKVRVDEKEPPVLIKKAGQRRW